MEDIFVLFMALFYSETALIFTALFTALFIVLIKRKNIVSRLPLFIIIAIFSPFVPVQVSACMAGINFSGTIPYVISIIGGVILAFTALCLYIKINVHPIDDDSSFLKKYNKKQIRLISARRLILTGAIETAVYSIPIIWVSAVWLDFLNNAVIQGAENIFEALENIIIQLMFPITNLIVIVPTLLIIFIFIIPALSSVMFLNGCIRTAVLTQENIIAKLLMAVFAFIPIVNIFFGFYCLKLISDSLKKEAAPC